MNWSDFFSSYSSTTTKSSFCLLPSLSLGFPPSQSWDWGLHRCVIYSFNYMFCVWVSQGCQSVPAKYTFDHQRLSPFTPLLNWLSDVDSCEEFWRKQHYCLLSPVAQCVLQKDQKIAVVEKCICMLSLGQGKRLHTRSWSKELDLSLFHWKGEFSMEVKVGKILLLMVSDVMKLVVLKEVRYWKWNVEHGLLGYAWEMPN